MRYTFKANNSPSYNIRGLVAHDETAAYDRVSTERRRWLYHFDSWVEWVVVSSTEEEKRNDDEHTHNTLAYIAGIMDRVAI